MRHAELVGPSTEFMTMSSYIYIEASPIATTCSLCHTWKCIHSPHASEEIQFSLSRSILPSHYCK